MEPFSNNSAATRSPQATSPWMGQPSAAGTHQGTPPWMAQPSPAGTPQAMPPWMEQSAAMPVGVQPTRLERSTAWPALRLIARWLKVIAWIGLVLGVIASLVVGGSTFSVSVLGGIGVVLIGLVGTAIEFILAFASAEFILVFLAIEKNTRKNE